MKKKFITLPIAGVLLYFVLTSYSTGPGAPPYGYERTGATGTVGCFGSICHASTATSTTMVSIQLMSGSTAVTSYTGGSSYNIVLTGTQMSSALTLPRFGFQLAAVKTGTSTNAGTLTAPASGHTFSASGINGVEHSAPILSTTGSGGAGTTYVVNIPWTAPAAGTGNITIYGVLNAVNFDGAATSADKWNNTSLVITESVSGAAPITGSLNVCVGSTTTLSDATTPGTWSSATTSVATVGSTTGIVTGHAPGTSVITYTAGSTGTATATVTVLATPTVNAITRNVICLGSTVTLNVTPSGGTWSASNANIAVGSATGIAIGNVLGLDTIKYTLTNACGTATATHTVSVQPTSICHLGVQEPAANDYGLKVYPDPAYGGSFTINLASDMDENAQVVIYNLMGTKVKEFTLHTNTAAVVQLDRAKGIYIIMAVSASGKYMTKFLID